MICSGGSWSTSGGSWSTLFLSSSPNPRVTPFLSFSALCTPLQFFSISKPPKGVASRSFLLEIAPSQEGLPSKLFLLCPPLSSRIGFKIIHKRPPPPPAKLFLFQSNPPHHKNWLLGLYFLRSPPQKGFLLKCSFSIQPPSQEGLASKCFFLLSVPFCWGSALVAYDLPLVVLDLPSSGSWSTVDYL